MKKHKSYLKFGIFLFGIALLLFNCQTETFTEEKELIFKTVPVSNMQRHFVHYKKRINALNGYLQRDEDDTLQIDVDWNTVNQEELDFTDALLTNVEAELNIETENNIRLIYININSVNFGAIETTKAEENFDNGKLKKGKIYYHLFDGTFFDAYKIENGIVTKRLVPKNNVNTASFLSFFLLFQNSDDDCDENLDPNSTFCDNELDEVTVTTSGGGGSSSIFYVGYYYPDFLEIEEGASGGGGGNNSSGPPCPNGQTKDRNGNCVTQPCKDNLSNKADPLQQMQILGSKQNGIPGGRYGNGRGRFHDGTDLSGSVGTPIFAMYSGVVAQYPYANSHEQGVKYRQIGNNGNRAGNRVYINSTFGGDNYQFGYWHMSEVVVDQGDYVSQGQIIGYMGTTGNANSDGSNGTHVHIRGRKNGQPYDPENSFSADLDDNGKDTNTNDCNN